ncbi:arginine deiminase [Vineibacter terrae]|uniref:arginine deiminase n=1 Tax=Vineibacter terrae TaxID=2586908 RepID=A0A5C8PP45_9HYPH|nr:arginine deiminase family protein [Vineibacter terrae]TXL75949.1 arginine deiminase [Vineibacter terrae]
MTWSVDSETGRLRDVLLCQPDHYTWLPYNTVAQRTLSEGGSIDAQQLHREFREFEDALARADVRCHYLERDEQLPYQVYTRDSSLMTPWGPVILQLMRPQRRGEVRAVVEFYQDRHPRWHWSTAGSIEGGDIHIIRPGLLLIGHSGERTTDVGARQLAAAFEAKGWEVRLQPFQEHFLHLDVLFCMAAQGLAVACVDVLDDDFTAWLGGKGIELIPVSYRDTMRLGCNLLSLGDDRVISPRQNVELNARLRAHGLVVYDPELSLFTRGGGGAHCMSMPLARDPLAPTHS